MNNKHSKFPLLCEYDNGWIIFLGPAVRSAIQHAKRWKWDKCRHSWHSCYIGCWAATGSISRSHHCLWCKWMNAHFSFLKCPLHETTCINHWCYFCCEHMSMWFLRNLWIMAEELGKYLFPLVHFSGFRCSSKRCANHTCWVKHQSVMTHPGSIESTETLSNNELP